jgi:CheY-like chemotaxis protein
VLIVDDEANARSALAELLVDEGYHVATAEDGHAALQIYEAFAPHVVVTDIRMPNMSGLELIGLLRRRSSDLILIVVTADAETKSRTAAMRHSADAYLIKPIDIDELLRTVARALDKARGRSVRANQLSGP